MIGSSSSLAFRSLLKSSASRAGLTRPVARLSGLTPAAMAFHAAAVAQERPVVIVVPTDADVETTAADARFFLAALLGLTERDAAETVLACPSLEVDPYRALTPHLAVASALEIRERNGSVLFAVVPDLLDHLRTTFDPSQGVAYDDRFNAIRGAFLLVVVIFQSRLARRGVGRGQGTG